MELKNRGLVCTRNIAEEWGEFLSIHSYKSINGLPNLQAVPEGTQNVDALSRKGERYSIKTISERGTTAGVFHGCGDENSEIIERKFEYVAIVQILKITNQKEY